jgi:DNA repair exonuclease SbcCD ATPase subunit
MDQDYKQRAHFKFISNSRASVESDIEEFKTELKKLEDIRYSLELAQVMVAGSCEICGNPHYPHCEED